jgi:hypothetical protein
MREKRWPWIALAMAVSLVMVSEVVQLVALIITLGGK